MSQDERISEHDCAGFNAFYVAEAEGQVQRSTLLRSDDALVGLFRRWYHLDEPSPYLNRAVLNGCSDHARRWWTQRRRLLRLRPIADADGSDERDVLHDILDRLPFDQRAAVVLHFYVGCTTAEIVDTIGCPPGSVAKKVEPRSPIGHEGSCAPDTQGSSTT